MFTSGVASGDTTSTSAVLWTRVCPTDHAEEVTVDWDVRPTTSGAARTGSAVACEARDHTICVELTDLDAATEYEYAFTVGDERVVGRTRTLPSTADHFRFAVTCCSRWGWPGFDLFDGIVDERPDLVLHLGDSLYEIGERSPGGAITDPPWDCHSLDDYRRRYRQHRSNPSWRRLLASVPMIAVWDDHEVADNAPEPGSAERRRAGQRAWAEWMPMRPADRPAPLDRTVSIESLMDLVLVDTRFGGRTPADTDGPEVQAHRGDLLGGDQWRRIDEIAATSASPWFVIANQVQVGPMTLGARPAIAWPPWRRVVNPDQWDGYPHERRRLYDTLQRVHGRPVVLSGDLHSAWSRTLFDGGDHGRRPVAHEFTCPSISGTTYAAAVRERLPIPAWLLDRWLRRINRGINHLDLVRHGYLVCDVTATTFDTTFVSDDGERHLVSLA